MTLQASYEKASKVCISKMFLWERYEAGQYWLTEEITEEKLDLIPGVVAKRAAIKDQITMWIKELDMV